MSTASYDVIIVGAGPAGLGAARRAAELGMKAALIERRSVLSPLARSCSEGLLYDERYHGDAVSVNTERGTIDFQETGYRMKYTGGVRGVPWFANFSPGGGRMKMVRTSAGPIHLVFDKGRFLTENLEDARAAGAAYFPNHTVVGIHTEKHSVCIETHRDRFTARFAVAADGHNSLCARLAGFSHHRTFYGTLFNACRLIEGFEPEEPGHIHLVEGEGGPAIICLCPRFCEGQYSFMIGSFSPGTRFDAIFDRIQTDSVLSSRFRPGTRVLHRTACVLNLFSPLTDPCRDRLFVVGDAAWMGQTSNSHAALAGFKAAECIFEALEERRTGDDAYRPYRQWWTETYAQHIRPPGANIFEALSGSELDELFSYMPDEIEGSLEPGAAQKLMGAFFQTLLPQIQQHNPELVKKIVAVQQQPTDAAWSEKRAQGIPLKKAGSDTAS